MLGYSDGLLDYPPAIKSGNSQSFGYWSSSKFGKSVLQSLLAHGGSIPLPSLSLPECKTSPFCDPSKHEDSTKGILGAGGSWAPGDSLSMFRGSSPQFADGIVPCWSITGWWFQPLWKIWVRQLGWWNSQVFLEQSSSHVAGKPPTIYIIPVSSTIIHY